MLEIGRSTTTPRPAKALEIDGTSARALDESPLEGTIEPLELVKIEPANAMELFTTAGALKPILERLAAEVRSIIPDPTTAKGRASIVSLAAKVGKAKNYIEEQGVALNRKLKEQPKLVDANKREAWNYLEALQKDTRQPVTDWEAEQERIEARRQADEAAALAQEIENAHEFAILLDRQRTMDIAQAAREQEEALLQEEERRREEAAEQARETAREELEAAARREQDALEAAEQAEQDRLAAEQRARDAEAREAQARKDADERAAKERELATQREEQAAQVAAQRERDRQAAEKRAEAAAAEARFKDKEHRKIFNNEALTDMVKMTGLSEEMAKNVISAISMNRVRHISIEY